MESPASFTESADDSLAVDCFRNYSAGEVFVQSLARQTDQRDVDAILGHQRDLLQRYEKTNEMLVNSTTVSAMRSQNAMQDFKKHVQLLRDMKKDLDDVFKKVRTLKGKMKERHPEAYAVAEGRISSLSTDSDDAEEQKEEKKDQEAGTSS